MVTIAASLVMQVPIVMAKVIEHNEPMVEVTPTAEVSPNPEPTEPIVVPTYVPPRMQTPDPENPENGGNVGGSIVRPTRR